MTDDATARQPDPVPARRDLPSAHRLVIQAFLDREELGLERYGARLLPDNGRSNPIDAFQEVLDLAVYWQNWITELRAYDGVNHRAVVMPSGKIAVRWDDPDATYPWLVFEPRQLDETYDGYDQVTLAIVDDRVQLRYAGDDEIARSGAVPLVRTVIDEVRNGDASNLDALFETCAAIEHDRWARWHRYVKLHGNVRDDGSLVIPARHVRKWDRLADTSYGDLTPEERAGDQAQVQDYWELIFGAPHPGVGSDRRRT